MTDLAEVMLLVIRQIPIGHVATYGQIARIAGKPKNARQVGAVLRGMRDSDVPWHRVVNARGEISERRGRSECKSIQADRLIAEGIVLSSAGRIDLDEYRWDA